MNFDRNYEYKENMIQDFGKIGWIDPWEDQPFKLPDEGMHIENPLGYNRKMKEIKKNKLKEDKANFIPGVPPKYMLINEVDRDITQKFYTLLKPNRYVMFNI